MNHLLKYAEKKLSDLKDKNDTVSQEFIHLGDNPTKKDIAEVKHLENKLLDANYTFSRNKRASTDLGNVKNKIIFNDQIQANERFSYLSLLAKYKDKIELAVGMSSKGIKINGVKLLILRDGLIEAKSYIAYKYCCKRENVSTTAKNDLMPQAGNSLANIQQVEYANMLFYKSTFGNVDCYYFGNSNDVQTLLNSGKIYINYDNQYKDAFTLNESQVGNISSIAPSFNAGRRINWIDLSLTKTDNDIVLSFFKEGTFKSIPTSVNVKVVFDIEFTVEDFIQNISNRRISDVILRDIIVSKNKKYLRGCLDLSYSIYGDGDLTNIFSNALTNVKTNSPEITLFNKYKSLYKTMVSMGINGINTASLTKFLKLMRGDVDLVRSSFEYNKSVGIVSDLIGTLDYEQFIKASSEFKVIAIKKQYDPKKVGIFIGEILKVGDMPLYLGDDKTFTANARAFLTDIPDALDEVLHSVDPTSEFLAKKKNSENNLYNPNMTDGNMQDNAFAYNRDKYKTKFIPWNEWIKSEKKEPSGKSYGKLVEKQSEGVSTSHYTIQKISKKDENPIVEGPAESKKMLVDRAVEQEEEGEEEQELEGNMGINKKFPLDSKYTNFRKVFYRSINNTLWGLRGRENKYSINYLLFNMGSFRQYGVEPGYIKNIHFVIREMEKMEHVLKGNNGGYTSQKYGRWTFGKIRDDISILENFSNLLQRYTNIRDENTLKEIYEMSNEVDWVSYISNMDNSVYGAFDTSDGSKIVFYNVVRRAPLDFIEKM